MKIPHQIVVFDKKIERWLSLVIILLLVLLIRLPSFFEPVWYLDESIYLTIGNALNDGQVLYRDIVDHKTPVIYYLAKVGGQAQFRLLFTLWMLVTTAGVFGLLKKIGLNKKIVWLATLGFGVATSLPKFEGLLPNGELFVMGFVVGGLILLSNSKTWRFAFNHKQRFDKKTTQHNSNNSKPLSLSYETLKQVQSGEMNSSIRSNTAKIFFGGFLLGLAILTKVPAIFDVIGVASLIYVGFWRQRTQKPFLYDLMRYFISIKHELALVTLGLLTPILLSIVYFVLRGAGSEYLQFGLLYNFRYAGTWVPTEQPIINTVLSLPVKMLILILITLLMTRLRKYLLPVMFWGGIWSLLALVAATLSNRPYPHYFVQVLLPLTFLWAGFLQILLDWWQKKAIVMATHRGLLTSGLVTTTIIIIFFATWQILQVWNYPTLNYYQKFAQMAIGRVSVVDYWQSFSPLVKDNYQVDQLMKEHNITQLYIWGINPSLYALTKSYPADPFTVLFHITDFNTQEQTALNVIKARPEVIAIMYDAEESPPPPLNSFIHSNYKPWKKLEHLMLWRLREAV